MYSVNEQHHECIPPETHSNYLLTMTHLLSIYFAEKSLKFKSYHLLFFLRIGRGLRIWLLVFFLLFFFFLNQTKRTLTRIDSLRKEIVADPRWCPTKRKLERRCYWGKIAFILGRCWFSYEGWSECYWPESYSIRCKRFLRTKYAKGRGFRAHWFGFIVGLFVLRFRFSRPTVSAFLPATSNAFTS